MSDAFDCPPICPSCNHLHVPWVECVKEAIKECNCGACFVGADADTECSICADRELASSAILTISNKSGVEFLMCRDAVTLDWVVFRREAHLLLRQHTFTEQKPAIACMESLRHSK